MGINNPVPRSLSAECRKAARILANFVKPNQLLGQDMVIPPEVLHNAKGLAIITQLKAGFLFSGRAGSGVIVARLPDGSWSAPSALVTAGAGVGGQIGAELTDFVFILNTQAAVDTFSHAGSITLGGNVSLAAGPLGRNAEVAGSASRGSVAAIFSYSKTKGLFAGVSLEGSVLVERREANRKFYGPNCTAKQILSGRVEPPPEADVLFRVLESRAFRTGRQDYYEDDFYDDIPENFSDSSSYVGRSGSRSGGRRGGNYDDDDYDDYDDYDRRGSSSSRVRNNNNNNNSNSNNSWEDDYYDRPNNNSSSLGRRGTTSSRVRENSGRDYDDDYDSVDRLGDQMSRSNIRNDSYSSHAPGRPQAPKPRWVDETESRRPSRAATYDDDNNNSSRYSSRRRDYDNEYDYDDVEYRRPVSRRNTVGGSVAPKRYDEQRRSERQREDERRVEASAGGDKAVALYTFKGEQDGDLDFKKGDVITIVKRSESKDDWWTGRRGASEGIFPANYVELM
ncbi:uncharacterized protein SAPINGB_P001283 [Magnusiomyces paraingens]|uniref:SH3 domain-containing protein n=1 Tax=Magnusiomyces paraingens TaxID=2606893 RepID=A0A5E8B6X7_9ASCO|nr:uncharacterized protein SAPINGB_P001283 [Saprochaete ingens]VVT46578.1 unnamed protein product [Saprochaete ingens]